MKVLLLFATAAWATAPNLLAQSAGGGAKDADAAWRALQAAVGVAPVALPGAANPAGTNVSAGVRVAAGRQITQQAREFYSAFPDHANAAAARRLEALATLRGVTSDDSAYEAQALNTAKAYRADTRNRVGDRIEVAILAERTAARNRFGGKVYFNDGPELEKIADGLRKEFGDAQEVLGFFLSVARTTEMNTSRSVAAKLVQSAATGDTRKEAEEILDRFALLGRTPVVPLRLLDGSDARVGQPGSQPTLLFFWPTAGPNPTNRQWAALPGDARILHVMLGASASQVTATMRRVNVPGTFCVETTPPGGAGGDLHVRHFPYIFAFGRDGKLAGYGPISAAGSVINSVNR